MRRSAARGAILLEVLISVALMIFGLAVVGLRVSTSLDTARRSQQWTTAVLLTETKMSELQAGAVPFKQTDDELAGYFGIRYPGYSWRILIEPCEIQDLYQMRLEIGYNPSVIEAQIANPDMEIDIEDEGTTIIRTVHRLVPKPADLDLNRDFGIDLEGLQEQMSGGTGGGDGGGEGGDPTGGAGNELWSLITQFLTEHPEILNDNGGIDLEAVKNLPAEDFQTAMQILEQFVGRGAGQLSDLQDQLSEGLEDAGGNQGGGRGGRGGQDGPGGNGQNGGGGGGINIGGGTGGTPGGPGGGPGGGRDGAGGRDGGRGRDRGGRDGGPDANNRGDRQDRGQDDANGGGNRFDRNNRGGRDDGGNAGNRDRGGRDAGGNAGGRDRGGRNDGGDAGNSDRGGRDRSNRDNNTRDNRNGDARDNSQRDNNQGDNGPGRNDRNRTDDRRSQFNRQGGTRGGNR